MVSMLLLSPSLSRQPRQISVRTVMVGGRGENAVVVFWGLNRRQLAELFFCGPTIVCARRAMWCGGGLGQGNGGGGDSRAPKHNDEKREVKEKKSGAHFTTDWGRSLGLRCGMSVCCVCACFRTEPAPPAPTPAQTAPPPRATEARRPRRGTAPATTPRWTTPPTLPAAGRTL